MDLRGLTKRLLPTGVRRELQRRIDGRKFGAGYLAEKGWFEGARNRSSVGPNGAPAPWITYPAREMLERVVRPSARVFEFGAGNSSLWWSSRVSFVAAVEHDAHWADTIRRQGPDNLAVALRAEGEPAPAEHRPMVDAFLAAHPDLPSAGDPALDITHGLNCVDFGAYAVEPANYGAGHFDVFVIDGMARSLCALVAAELVAENGIIVFDNSERWHYNPGFTELGKRGWKRLDFFGPGPAVNYEWCTSIFCRDLDWLPADLTIPADRRRELR